MSYSQNSVDAVPDDDGSCGSDGGDSGGSRARPLCATVRRSEQERCMKDGREAEARWSAERARLDRDGEVPAFSTADLGRRAACIAGCQSGV